MQIFKQTWAIIGVRSSLLFEFNLFWIQNILICYFQELPSRSFLKEEHNNETFQKIHKKTPLVKSFWSEVTGWNPVGLL